MDPKDKLHCPIIEKNQIMTLGSCSSAALGPGLVVSEVSKISLHITAVSSFNMPMELVGPEILDFAVLIYSEIVTKSLPSPTLLQDTGIWMIMDDNF